MNQLILLRHGQSLWNQKNLFTGWVDIPLSRKGVDESVTAGVKIREIPIDEIYTSTLIRAHMTLTLALLEHKSEKLPVFVHPDHKKLARFEKIYSEKAKAETIPVHMAWELNERMYGELQGLNKAETAEKYGKEQVHIWRRSYDAPPPNGESLKMTAERTIPYFEQVIVPEYRKGKTLLIVAHGNSLRSIVMQMEHLSPEEVMHLEIETGDPLIYTETRGVWTKK